MSLLLLLLLRLMHCLEYQVVPARICSPSGTRSQASPPCLGTSQQSASVFIGVDCGGEESEHAHQLEHVVHPNIERLTHTGDVAKGKIEQQSALAGRCCSVVGAKWRLPSSDPGPPSNVSAPNPLVGSCEAEHNRLSSHRGDFIQPSSKEQSQILTGRYFIHRSPAATPHEGLTVTGTLGRKIKRSGCCNTGSSLDCVWHCCLPSKRLL